jgi:ArsR family transcriptional regulator, lead/cadmium/zinc/bismuth-responsive transcriptional repressor
MLSMMDKQPASSVLNEHLAAHVAELFRAFSDTSRVRIVSALMGGEMNISALAKVVGISESAVSHHMRGLRQMRMVQSRREGKEVYYRIDDEHVIALFQQGVKHVQNG